MAASMSPPISKCISHENCQSKACLTMETELKESVIPILYVELKPRLSVVQFFMYGHFKSYCVICAEKDTLNVRVPPTGRQQFKFTDFTVDPLSSNGLSMVSHEELQWRMTLTSLFNAKVKDTVQIEDSFVARNVGCSVKSHFEKERIVVSCQNCKKELFARDRPFSKVLPLPSDGWREVAENWFCHKDKEDVPEIKRLRARQDEVLTGDTDFYMALNRSVTHSFKLRERSGDLLCDRCAKVIGSGYRDDDVLYAEVHLHAVVVSSNKRREEETVISRFTSSQYCDVLFSDLLLQQAQIYTSFRFVVESKVEDKFRPFILVWLMDQQAFIGSPSVKMSNNEIVFVPVIKLLYQGCIGGRNKETADLWSRDMAVHTIELPYLLCLKVLSSLIKSTHNVPPSLRYLNGFHVGHLRR